MRTDEAGRRRARTFGWPVQDMSKRHRHAPRVSNRVAHQVNRHHRGIGETRSGQGSYERPT